jgi:hypothetical protein
MDVFGGPVETPNTRRIADMGVIDHEAQGRGWFIKDW